MLRRQDYVEGTEKIIAIASVFNKFTVYLGEIKLRYKRQLQIKSQDNVFLKQCFSSLAIYQNHPGSFHKL